MKKMILLLLGLGLNCGLNAQSKTNGGDDKKVPEFKNEKQKQDWIKENPEKYKAMGGNLSEEQEKQIKEKEALKKANSEMPEFPKYVDTGNPQLDKQNYEKSKADWYAKKIAIDEKNGVYNQSSEEKENWIKQHPELYNRK
jgi:hypothetical protein